MKLFRDYLIELTAKPAELEKFRKDVKNVKSVDSRDNSWSRNLKDYMSNYGFKLLGAGKYASVYGKPSYDYVIKVFMKDSAYLKWIKFAKDHQDNPYMPRVKGKVLKISDYIYAIRLEKLTTGDYTKTKFFKEYSTWQKDNSYVSSDENIQEVLVEFGKNKKLIDIHGENVMFRGEQLVIIDAYYNFFNPNEKKFTIDPEKVDSSMF